MLQLKRNRSAFTLIELLVVVIIVAVLAAVGVPLLSANVTRAKASEAESGLGTIRTVLRAKKSEIGSYPILSGALNSGTPTVAAQLGLAADDLNGRWFTTGSYTLTSADGTTYNISADGNVAFGPGADTGSKTIKRCMDEDGTIVVGATSC